MTTFRTIVIGDVHGCAEELHHLLDVTGARDRNNRVVMLGDLMDKGPYPLECLQVVMNSGFEMVAANHEEWHVRWWKREAEARESGGKKPNKMKPPHRQRDAEVNAALTAAQVAWLESLPPWLEVVPGWVAVHGGFNPALPLAQQDPKKVVRMRYVTTTGDHVPIDYDGADGPKQPTGTYHWTERWLGPESVVYGHEAFSLSKPREVTTHLKLTDGGSRWVFTRGIDTGCVHGGHLTALIFEDGKPLRIEQVKAKRVYQEPLLPIPE